MTRTLTLKSPADEFLHVVANVPAEIAQWWRDGHRWDREKYVYSEVEGPHAPGGGRTIALVRSVHPDYTVWRALGYVSDALLLILVLTIVLTVALALI
jgi:hypothetical protein